MVRHPGAGGGDEEDAALELAARRKRLQQAEDAWVAADALRGGKGLCSRTHSRGAAVVNEAARPRPPLAHPPTP